MEKYKNYEYFYPLLNLKENPKTILEALSNECIVFASKILNHSELIEDGVNGFLLEAKMNLLKNLNLLKIITN